MPRLNEFYWMNVKLRMQIAIQTKNTLNGNNKEKNYRPYRILRHAYDTVCAW